MKSAPPLLLLSALLLLPLRLTAQLAPPSLVVDQDTVDLGEARAGTKLTHTFTLKNQGQKLLQIRNVRASCGCTASELSSREIPAGGQATLTASLDLTGRSGPQSEQIRLQTNDPESPTRVLTLKAVAIPRVQVTPRTLNFQQVSAEAPPTGRIILETTTDVPLNITGIQSAQNRVETTLTEITPGKTYHLEVTPTALDKTGHFSERLEIKTDDPEMPAIPVLVMWQVAQPVSVAPRQLNLMLSDPPQPMTRFLMIRGQADLDPPLEITDIQWQGRDIEMTVHPAGTFGTRVEFSVTPLPDMDGEKIIIQTNVPGFERLILPIRVLNP